MDDSTYNDEGRVIDLPDGLVHFRMNLVELLVDICHLLGSSIFMQKVLWESCTSFSILNLFQVLSFMFCTFYYGMITSEEMLATHPFKHTSNTLQCDWFNF